MAELNLAPHDRSPFIGYVLCYPLWPRIWTFSPRNVKTYRVVPQCPLNSYNRPRWLQTKIVRVKREGSRLPALFAFCYRKGVGCYVTHSGNLSTKVSKKFAIPIIKHCIFCSVSKEARVMPSSALSYTSGKAGRALNPRSDCYRGQQNLTKLHPCKNQNRKIALFSRLGYKKPVQAVSRIVSQWTSLSRILFLFGWHSVHEVGT